MSTSTSFSRRSFLGFTGLSVASVATLTACGGGSSNNGGAAASADVKLPTYKEFTGVTPDLPGNAEGLVPGFLKFPSELVASTTEKPAKGPISGLSETFTTPPPAMNDNPFWQRLNEALGGEFNLTIGTDPGYPEKFATILASNDLPDMMWLPPNQGIPNVGPMLEAKFQDLTEYLSGDAVLEYPNLAALKPASWKTAVVNGKIWGAPIPSTPFGQVMIGNPKYWEPLGGFQCKNAQEFYDKCVEFGKRPNSYALQPAYINILHMATEWYGAPNGWRVNEDRTLTSIYETDAYKQGLDLCARLFAAGCFHPDTNMSEANTGPYAANGTLGAEVVAGPTGAAKYRLQFPDLFMDTMIPFGAESGITPSYDMGYGTVGFTPFKKADESKIRELLAVINWLSSPFGTKEWLQKGYGTEGKDFEFDSSGAPQLTESGRTNAPGLTGALGIMASPESVLFSAIPQDTQSIYDTSKELLKNAKRNPTNGLYSDTNSKVGPKIRQNLYDKVTDIITGRAPVSDIDAAVKRYFNDGGEKIRQEFQEALPSDTPVG
ncbi:sugar ABC transporter substrate-binding protein [Haematomicrobium sanguinis]|uniref:sugar ABC transporter substrate-binding protein n=1 Tax=Haematomicrobium sanguinis TaxID=479106 RepID=UPI00047D1B92|nr:sugar ABC transporter substrate-binding protein [Haematomicrobium sanguinis]